MGPQDESTPWEGQLGRYPAQPPPQAQLPDPSGLIGLIRHRSETAGTQPYLLGADGDRCITYGGLVEAIYRWGQAFDDLGVPPGERIGLAVSDPLEFAAVFLSVITTGRWVTPFDPSAPDPVLVGSRRHLGLALMITDRPCPPEETGAWTDLSDGSPVDAVATAVPLPPVRTLPAPVISRPGGVILSSSGTTGTPKIIGLDERRLMHTARMVAEHHGLAPEDRGFNPLPLFHINGEVVGLLATLVAGGSIVLDDRFHRLGFWERVTASGATWVNAVPAIIARLCEEAHPTTRPDGLAARGAFDRPRSQIRFVRSASAPLPVSVLERFERLHRVPVVETYGMTEAGSQICANPVAGPRRPGSVGCPIGVELRIRWRDRCVGAGEVGMVEIRGPGVIDRYLGPGQDHRFAHDGWLVTGDMGSLDQDGYLYLAGRIDDVINRGGEKVFPREVEDVILEDRRLAAAVVVGRADPVLGEVPVAYLVLQPAEDAGGGAVAEDVIDRARWRCETLLPRAKRPISYQVLRKLPVGPTGKVQRHRLGTRSAPAPSLTS
ncbi:MAG: AMP-binding protein [Acidimicrobiales bacterium]